MANDWCEGNIIKAYRKDRGLTQRELAEEMSKVFPGVDKALISKMENGLCEPTEEMREWCCNTSNRPIGERNDAVWEVYLPESEASQMGYLSPLEQEILDRLQETDIDHRLTRSHLWSLFGSDRMNRRAIETLRSYGYRIGSGLGAEGYWLIRDDEEYKRFSKEYSSRAYKVMKTKSAMDNYVEGQIRL